MNVADGSSSVISFWDQALLIEMTNVLPHLISFAVSSLQQMASGTSASRILEQRRCLLLATLGSTAETVPGNTTLKALLHAGLLFTIKGWLDDILDGKVGGVDLLLHLLTNIIPLPVTKELVTVSKLGKTVSSVEKHKFCIEGANQAAIRSRIQQVKEQWSASVKSLRNVSIPPRPKCQLISSRSFH